MVRLSSSVHTLLMYSLRSSLLLSSHLLFNLPKTSHKIYTYFSFLKYKIHVKPIITSLTLTCSTYKVHYVKPSIPLLASSLLGPYSLRFSCSWYSLLWKVCHILQSHHWLTYQHRVTCEAVYIVYVLIYSPQRLSSCRLKFCDSHEEEPMFFPQRALRLSRFLWHISKRWYSFINSSYVLQNYFTVTFCIISCVQTAFLIHIPQTASSGKKSLQVYSTHMCHMWGMYAGKECSFYTYGGIGGWYTWSFIYHCR